MVNYKNFSDTKELARWNDEMVSKYHKEGTLFESKNIILRNLEKLRLNKIIKFSKLKEGVLVLDLGCGEGYLLSILPPGINAVGVDISQVALKNASKRLRGKDNIKFFFGNANHTDFQEKNFDRIICSEVLEHVPNPRQVIEEMHRLIKDDGIAVISVPDERRIKSIMRILEFTRLSKFLYAARKEEKYEWHLHEADKNFIEIITKNLFKIDKIVRSPACFGYRFVARLSKII